MTTTETTAPFGSTRTNPNGPTIANAQTSYDEELLLFCPARNEVIVVPLEESKAVLEEANEMESLYRSLAEAKNKLLTLEDQLASAEAIRYPDHAAINQLNIQIKAAQKRYDAAYEEIKSKLGDKGYLATSGNGKELLELIPLMQRKPGSKSRDWARKWTYVRSDKVDNHWRKYKMNKAEQNQSASFIKQGKIDTKTLKEQFTKLEPKLKAEWGLAHEAGELFPNLQAWAETLNQSANEKSPVQFKAEVQLFRYFAGCGAGAEWNPKGGKIAGKLNGKAEIMLAHGECKTEVFLPGPEGWAWSLTGVKSGTEYHIGAFRYAGSMKLEAGAGASVAAELSLEVDYSGALPKAKGTRRPKNTQVTSRKVALDKLGAEVNAGADAFAGVKASCELVGGLQYLSPEKGDKFEYMASIGPKVEAQFGAGAAANLLIVFENGKFRIKAKAGLCFGPGAKGEIGLEVDAKRIASFLEWLFHALLNADFEILQVVTEDAYIYATQLHVLLINGLGDAYNGLSANWTKFEDILDKEAQRVTLMNCVLSNPPELRFCTPEAHGILLYQLTRHGNLTKLNPANTGWDFELLGRRKEAVLQVCRWAQTKRQFENMVQHLSADGSDGGFQANYAGLLRFMEIGPLDSAYDDQLRTLYARLPNRPARGFKVAMNDSKTFEIQSGMEASHTYLAKLKGSDA